MNNIAFIGGTGLNNIQGIEITDQVTVDTPYGAPSGAIQSFKYGDHKGVFLARHGQPHQLPPHQINYRANIHALKQLGVSHILAVNAVGGISTKAATGQICIPDQLIDYTWGREHTFSQQDADSDLLSVQHIDFSYPFSESLRQHLITQGKSLSLPISDSGTYAVTQGPRLETAAEIKKYAQDGCDLVGMTAMPEAALAREVAIEYASISLVVNPAAGISDEIITMEDIQKVVSEGMGKVTDLLLATFNALKSDI